MRPASPYAVARVAQENLSMVYARGFKLDIVCTRSFNHVGAGQPDSFVVSALARRFVEFMAGQRPSITAGDTGIVRDFLDVRDVVRAYRLLLQKGRSGEVYNVCSGRGWSIDEIITMLMQITGARPPIEVDRSLLRPVENRVVVGSYAKLHALTGWRPEIELKETLASVVKYWQTVLRVAAA
jgi:GDP-4-dehydro-6-deoxy-D-mannose reductase